MDDRQLEYRGVTIGHGTDFPVVTVEGLDAPSIRASDRGVSRRHGQHPGDDFYEGRTVMISGYIRKRVPAEMSATRELVVAALGVGGKSEEPLRFQLPAVAGGGARRIMCRPRRDRHVVDRELIRGNSREVFQLHATDPRIYDDTESSDSVGLPAGGAGLTWPLTWPLNWGAITESGTITAVNAGNFDTGATIRVDGPVTNPRIENLTVGKTIEIDIVVATGDFLEIDTEENTVLLNGTASRYDNLTSTSQWWDLQPGSNEVRFRASTTTAATLTLTWRSAWIA